MKKETRSLNLQHDEVLWSEPLEDRIRRFRVDRYLLDLASTLQPGEQGVFGRFHAWEREE